jgi:hypothetical protein
MSIIRPITNVTRWSPIRGVVSTQGGKGLLILEELPYICIPWSPKSLVLTSNVRARGIHVIGDLPYILIPWNNQVIANVLGTVQGIFECNSTFGCSFEGIAQANRFQSDMRISASFRGEPHIHFQSDCHISAQFGSKGRVNGQFASSCTVSAVFESAAVTYPRFRVDATFGFVVYVRAGQGPDCYYDNAAIIADPTRNYVF